MGRYVTVDSKIKDIYSTPVGHDILKKVLLSLNLKESLILNPIVMNLRVADLSRVFKNKLDPNFIMSLLHLINQEEDVPSEGKKDINPAWWKEAVFYQIYPRSFYDSNNDGIGDIPGIIKKLDYLKDLGIDAIWLSPIYDSPNDDNGYDIRDYRKIMKEFGTMEDFDTLLRKLHKRDMKLIMDLVINHTSDEHEWFLNAINNKDSKYRDYYFIKEKKKDSPPNNWTSYFSGPAWEEKNNSYYLHLFSKKQPDLNWDNPALREEIYDMIRFWLEKGVDGFRMDVINFISKEDGLPDGNEKIAALMGFTGVERYFYGPNLHKYLREIREKAFSPYNAFSVGECPGIGMEMGKLITGEDRKELDMMFSFDHLETRGKSKFSDYEYDLNFYRDYIIDFMENYKNNVSMSLFYNNHDNPRMVSKIFRDAGKEENTVLRQHLEILLITMQLTLKGTPFIYQGDEMGLTNYDFKSMDEINDIESINLYNELIKKGKSEEEAFKIIKSGTRDHARVLLPFGTEKEDKAVFNAYKDLIKLRKENKTFCYGDFALLNRDKNHFTYKRSDDKNLFVIDLNLSKKKIPSVFRRDDFTLLFSPYFLESGMDYLSPYEARIFVKRK